MPLELRHWGVEGHGPPVVCATACRNGLALSSYQTWAFRRLTRRFDPAGYLLTASPRRAAKPSMSSSVVSHEHISRTVPEPRASYAWEGADTDTVLGGKGFSAAEIDDLRAQGAIA